MSFTLQGSQLTLYCYQQLSLCSVLLLAEDKSYQWRWIASTLNPHYEGNSPLDMIQDDRFISVTSDHWYFGADNTGNIFSSDFLESLALECSRKDLSDVHLVHISVITLLSICTYVTFPRFSLIYIQNIEISLKIIARYWKCYEEHIQV